MRHLILVAALLLMPTMTAAKDARPVIRDILDAHILPGFDALASQTQTLAAVAAQDCDPASDALRSAYGTAFDAWVSVSHLRFGPTEVDDRAFALAFWPDTRGATPRALAVLIADDDPIAMTPDRYADVSIAARGFYALEYLLYDPALMLAGKAAYRCTLIQTVSADIAYTSQAIWQGWHSDHAGKMRAPGPDTFYRHEEEVLQELFKALTTGLQFTSETRLGRPLGTFDRPRPYRAEVRKSGRSSRHVMLSLSALKDLALRLAMGDANLADDLEAHFADTLSRLSALEDPTFADVTDPGFRFKVEVLQQSVDLVRATVREALGPTLGVAAGFNSMDGD